MRSSSGPVAGGRLRYWLGVGLGSFAALAYALIVVLAKTAYAGGSDPLTIVTARVLLFAVGLFLFLALSGRPIRLPRRQRRASIAIGLVVAAQAFAYYSSVRFIPVGLAVLFFATYPLQTALLARAIEGEPLTRVRIGALIAAFAGVALTLDSVAGPLDPLGILLALAGGTGMAVVIVGSARVLRSAPLLPVSCHITGATSAVCIAVLAATGGPALPAGAGGWLALAGVPVVYVAAVLCFYGAIPMIGATRIAMAGNMEIPFTLLLAVLVLGEAVTPLQLAGAALVVGAVYAVQISGGGRPPGQPAGGAGRRKGWARS